MKPDERYDLVVWPYTGFPGEIAGASLKPAPPAHPRAGDIDDSPAKSPGPH